MTDTNGRIFKLAPWPTSSVGLYRFEVACATADSAQERCRVVGLIGVKAKKYMSGEKP
jgi:hypothetical protein